MSRIEAAPSTGEQHDQGFSLVEVVVATVLMGTAVAALLTALLATVTSSRVQRAEVTLDHMLKSSAESVLSRSTPYVNCATPSSYVSVLPSDPAGQVTVTITAVQVWNGQNPPLYGASCGTDPGAALITLRATTDNGESQQLQIVKRRSGS